MLMLKIILKNKQYHIFKYPQNLFNNNFVRLAGEFKWSKLAFTTLPVR